MAFVFVYHKNSSGLAHYCHIQTDPPWFHLFLTVYSSCDHVNKSPLMTYHVELCMYEIYAKPLTVCSEWNLWKYHQVVVKHMRAITLNIS